jgi:putative transposase
MQPQFEELTDAQWQVIKEILKDNRKRKHNLRDVVNGILEILRTGTQWRNLNHSKLSWQVICYYFRRWKTNGTLERLNSCLNVKERSQQNRQAAPSLLYIDSQSIKSVSFVNQDKGIDGNKFVNGRKRHLIVDTLGLIWGVVVHAADIHDGTKAHLLIEHCLGYLEPI